MLKKGFRIGCCCMLFGLPAVAQLKTDSLLQTLLNNVRDSIVQRIIDHPDSFRLQVIYTQINRNAANHPSFTNYYFHCGDQLYFNPASTVKLPLAILALEKLNRLHVPGVDKNTTIMYDSSFSGQKALEKDSTSETGLPSIANFIKKAFLISDNDAYNRLYQFTGQETANNELHKKGYTQARITRQFMRLTPDENRHTNDIRFIGKDGHLIYRQEPAYNSDSFDFSRIAKLGNGYYDRNDSLIHEPMDFTTHNNLPLQSLQQLLQSVMFPTAVAPERRLVLRSADLQFLRQYLSQYPSETNYPRYDTALFYDSYVKFYFRNGGHAMPPEVRVFNKVGWAYGFLTDVSYVADFKNKVEFMLSCTLYVNSDGILNDNKYDYESLGWPFFYALGQAIYHYELSRKKSFPPNLQSFRINYEHRNVHDKKPAIRDVDN